MKRIVALALMVLTICTAGINAQSQPTRNPLLWPFSRYSIWNMPLGSNAVYAPVNMSAPDTYAGDINYFHVNSSRAKYVSSLNGGAILVDDGNWVNNNDSRNVVLTIINNGLEDFRSIQPGRRESPTGKFNGYLWTGGNEYYPNQKTIEQRGELQNYYGYGIEGAHWGSGLSGLGGTIRLGELVSDDPIRHALAVEVSGWKCLMVDETDKTMDIEAGDFTMRGFRWPADRSDGCSGFFGGENGCYKSNNPVFRMGALLALKPDLDIEDMGLTTDAAKKLAWTFQNYGGYMIDDSYGLNNNPPTNIFNFCYELGVNEEFKSEYGYDFDISWDRGTKRQKDFFKDMDIIIPLLHVISNNGPKSIGGGGNPLQCLAPAFSGNIMDGVAQNPNGAVVEPNNCNSTYMDVTNINVNPTSVNLIVYDTVSIHADVLPVEATINAVKYESANTKIAKVNSRGIVSAVGSGETIITATTIDGDKTANIEVSVENGISLPSLVEAEDWKAMSGVTKESTTDEGGGDCVSSVDKGDWLEYVVYPVAGDYDIEIRYASATQGSIEITFSNSLKTTGVVTLPATGGSQSWATATAKVVKVRSGNQIMGINFKSNGIKLNYVNIKSPATSISTKKESSGKVSIFPNPLDGNLLNISTENYKDARQIEIYDLLGNCVLKKSLGLTTVHQVEIDKSKFCGLYMVKIKGDSREITTKLFINK